MMPKIFSQEDRTEISNRLKANALQLLREKPYRKITVEEITGRTGIAKGTFYNFFTSKEDFFYIILLEMSGENVERIRAIAGRQVSKKQELRSLLAEMILDMESPTDNLDKDDISIITRLKNGASFPDEAKLFAQALYDGRLKIRKDADRTTVENLLTVILQQRKINMETPIRNYGELVRLLVKALVNYLYE